MTTTKGKYAEVLEALNKQIDDTVGLGDDGCLLVLHEVYVRTIQAALSPPPDEVIEVLARLTSDVEYLNDTYYEETALRANKRSIDYEHGNLELTLGDLKVLRNHIQGRGD